MSYSNPFSISSPTPIPSPVPIHVIIDIAPQTFVFIISGIIVCGIIVFVILHKIYQKKKGE